MVAASAVVIRRGRRSPAGVRRPLRLEIRRRRASGRGTDRFVTQVLLGDHEAVLVPHRAEAVVPDALVVAEGQA